MSRRKSLKHLRPSAAWLSGVLIVLIGAAASSFAVRGANSPAAQPAAPQTPSSAAGNYFPERFNWQHKKPEEVGMDAARLDDAVKFAVAKENPLPREMARFRITSYPREQFLEAIGPVKDRGPATGLVTRHGYIVAEWGEPSRVDMTFSATKTFLTTVIGLAWQRGLIRDVNDYARNYMPADVDLFEAPHNQKIKWDDLLRQTSDWSGTLWGKPDWADRPPKELQPQDYIHRQMYEPGTHYKYNDVRVNVMALAALEVWRRPLQEVLREEIMNPIGASSTWRWFGYDNSWVEIDGQKMQAPAGGGHWGGGMFINAYDMARFGYLFLRHGKWDGHQLVSEKWIAMARTPGPANPNYGFANWFLNTGREPLPSAPAGAVCFIGDGRNVIYIDWDNDVVAVVRWIGTGIPPGTETTSLGPNLDGFVSLLLGSITAPSR